MTKKQDSHYQQQQTDHNLIIGKVPPQAIDVEEIVLGVCMIETGAYEQIAHLLEPEHFYKEAHHLIFAAIQQLFINHEPIDIITVTQQ